MFTTKLLVFLSLDSDDSTRILSNKLNRTTNKQYDMVHLARHKGTLEKYRNYNNHQSGQSRTGLFSALFALYYDARVLLFERT